VGSINERIATQADPGIKQDPISKITKAKRIGSVAEGAQCLPPQAQSPEFNPKYCLKKLKSCIYALFKSYYFFPKSRKMDGIGDHHAE
jgi:hypothetical protein